MRGFGHIMIIPTTTKFARSARSLRVGSSDICTYSFYIRCRLYVLTRALHGNSLNCREITFDCHTRREINYRDSRNVVSVWGYKEIDTNDSSLYQSTLRDATNFENQTSRLQGLTPQALGFVWTAPVIQMPRSPYKRPYS